MNIKLLKKVRKRFSIHHCPNGVYIGFDHMDFNLFVLYDKESEYGTVYAQLHRKPNCGSQAVNNTEIFDTETDCINYLKSRIIRRLTNEGYGNARRNRVNNKSKKVWYK
jgi:hypothetical protein